jgi:hypothetical protein
MIAYHHMKIRLPLGQLDKDNFHGVIILFDSPVLNWNFQKLACFLIPISVLYITQNVQTLRQKG